MRPITPVVSGLVIFALALPRAQTPPAAPAPIACQGAATAPPPVAAPAGPGAAGQGRGRAGGQAQPAGDRPVTVTAIPGVIAAGAAFTQVYSTAGANADGIIATTDGSVLVNQEENNLVIKIDKDDRASIYLADTRGSGALSRDRQGRILAVVRIPTAGSISAARPNAPTTAGVSMLFPERKTVADTFSNGKKWLGRPNDLSADSTGGAYFTQDCVYYASATGTISLVAENLRANGIVLSLDDTRLFVTNPAAAGGNATVVAFDVQGPGKLANRRTFATLEAGGTADAMTVDSTGRLYVASTPGIQVFSTTGAFLGLIPTPRAVTGEVFAGPDRRMLYLVSNAAVDANGLSIAGRTVYRIPTLAQGMMARSK